MSKFTPDAVLDVMPIKVATATRQVVCSGQPANFAGIAAVALADVTMTAGDGNGDYSLVNGGSSGRALQVAQQASVPIDASGTATHISYDDGSALLYVTTCTSQALTSGGTVTVPQHVIANVADPS